MNILNALQKGQSVANPVWMKKAQVVINILSGVAVLVFPLLNIPLSEEAINRMATIALEMLIVFNGYAIIATTDKVGI